MAVLTHDDKAKERGKQLRNYEEIDRPNKKLK